MQLEVYTSIKAILFCKIYAVFTRLWKSSEGDTRQQVGFMVHDGTSSSINNTQFGQRQNSSTANQTRVNDLRYENGSLLHPTPKHSEVRSLQHSFALRKEITKKSNIEAAKAGNCTMSPCIGLLNSTPMSTTDEFRSTVYCWILILRANIGVLLQ